MKLFHLPRPDPSIGLRLKKGCKEVFVMLSDILYCCAHRNYTCFHLVNGEKYLSSKTLSQVNKELNPYGFFMVNKSCLVNRIHIRCISVNGHSEIILTGNEKISLSRRRKAIIEEIFYNEPKSVEALRFNGFSS